MEKNSQALRTLSTFQQTIMATFDIINDHEQWPPAWPQ